MKTIKKNVYYCDFCKKKGLSASAMAKHEKHCTGNVNRDCRMCGFGLDYQKIIDRLTPAVKQVPEMGHPFGDKATGVLKEIMDDIHDEVEGCPACCLTILRKLGSFLPVVSPSFQFDYKKEVASWWAERNAEDAPDYSDIQ